MIKKIINDASAIKTIVAAAQELVNAQFDKEAGKIFNKRNKEIEPQIELFRQSLEASQLTELEGEFLRRQTNISLFNLAREIVLRLLKAELKSS
jgi:hypothetical protein